MNITITDALKAFARVYGLVRYFHPSDQAFETDWVAFAIQASEYILKRQPKDREELRGLLLDLFLSVAPSIQIVAEGEEVEAAGQNYNLDDPETGVRVWRHYGYEEVGYEDAVYGCEWLHIKERADYKDGYPKPDTPYRTEIGGGLEVIVPLAIYTINGETVPRDVKPSVLPEVDFETIKKAPLSSESCVASIVVLWNAIQHFYPYSEFIEDWDKSLHEALEKALKTSGEKEMRTVIKQLAGEVNDGHLFVTSGQSVDYYIPFTAARIEGKFYVSAIFPSGAVEVMGGSELVSVNGQTLEDFWKEVSPVISSATEGWREVIAFRMLTSTDKEDLEVQVKEPGSALTKTVSVSCRLLQDANSGVYEEHDYWCCKHPSYYEVEDKIWYVDTLRVSRLDMLHLIPRLAKADAIIFDARGYPTGAFTDVLLPHLSRTTLQCARWNIAEIFYPDQHNVIYDESRWDIVPKEPFIEGKKFFLTGPSAISYAETCLAIVEHYKLGTLVGEQTAGTNGNLGNISLPAGLNAGFTAMKVVRHDGEAHHGRGILPEMEVKQTVDGLVRGVDEVFAQALRLARG